MLTPEEMAAQAEQALELGATPEEVEAVVSHGTPSVRNAVASAVRRNYTGAGDRHVFPPAPTGRSSSVAAHTALIASVFEGTDAHYASHQDASEEGIPNNTIRNSALLYQNSFAQRPATDLITSPDGLEVAQAVTKDPYAAVAAAFVERALALPETDEEKENYNSNILRRQAADNWPTIVRGIYPDTSGLEEAKYGLFNDLNWPENKVLSYDPAKAGTLPEVGVAFAGEMIPGKTGLELFNWSRTALEKGLISNVEHQLGTAFHGNLNQRIKQHIAMLPAEEQGPFFTEFMQAFVDKAGTAATPFTVWLFAEGIVPDNFLATMQPNDRLQFITDNVVGALATLEVAMASTVIAAPIASVIASATSAMRGALPGARNAGKALMATRPSHYANTVSALFNRMDEAEFLKRWGISKADVVRSQLPKDTTDALLDNIPDNVVRYGMDERLDKLVTVISDDVRKLARNIHTTDERLGIVESLHDATRQHHAHAYRPALSRMEVADDDSSITFFNTIGKDEHHGFGSLREAVDKGQEYAPFEDLTFFRVNAENKIEPYKPKVTKDSDGRWTAADGQDGEFFFQYKQQHYFSPFDQAVFGGDPVIAGSTLGLWGRRLGAPSSHLHPEIWQKFTNAFVKEQSLANLLDSVAAPMFKELSSAKRREVNNILLWAEDFGKKNGRNPSAIELRQAFSNVDDAVEAGYYQSRLLFDTVWQIENDMLYRAWHGQGYKTLANKETKFHGAPLSPDQVKRMANEGNLEVLDAATMQPRVIKADDVDALFRKNGGIIRMDLPMESVAGTTHRLVMGDSDSGFRIRELSKTPHKYIPGYYPRMYKDPHYIEVRKAGRVDGVEDEIRSTVAVATTRKEADRHVMRLIDEEGERLFKGKWPKELAKADKVRLLESKGVHIDVLEDKRLTAIDRQALDLRRFQVEGRLFFDNRNEKPLTDVYGNPAETVDPINTMHRTARMVARQVAMEDLVTQQKNQFFAFYSDRIPELRNMRELSSKEVSSRLRQKMQVSRGDDQKLVTNAYNWWRQITVFDGTITQDVSAFRKATIAAAEWFDYNIGWKFTGKREGIRAWTRGISRNAHEFSPYNIWKSLAFLRFITARPLRQLFLQGGQHFSIQAIDPAYIGRWQMDTMNLLFGTRSIGKELEGGKVGALRKKITSSAMGYSQKEYDILIDQYHRSGLLETVDLHAYAGGRTKADTTTAETALGQATKTTAAAARWPITKMRQYGFDLGEQYNVTASWLLALRRYKKENGITDLTRMTQDDWDKVLARGSGYAMAMHRANMAEWQHGWLSAPLQFLQFTHKWTLTMMGASDTMRKLGLANLNFTKSEAQRIVAGQMLLFGAAGIPFYTSLKEKVRTNLNRSLEENDLPTLPEEAIDLIASGVLDYVLDSALRTIADDPDLDLAWDDAFSPGQGMHQSLRAWGEAAFGNRLWETVGGPGAQVASSFVKMAKEVTMLTGGHIEGMKTEEQIAAILEHTAAGFLSSGSDYLKVKMAHKVGQWTNQRGEGLGAGLEAKWEELLAKGLLGVNPQKLLDYYAMSDADKKRMEDIRKDAWDAASTLSRVLGTQGEGMKSAQGWLAATKFAEARLLAYSDDDRDRNTYLMEFFDAWKSLKVENKDMFQRLAEGLVQTGDVPNVLYFALNAKNITPEQKAVLEEAMKKALEDRPAMTEQQLELYQRQQGSIRRLSQDERFNRDE